MLENENHSQLTTLFAPFDDEWSSTTRSIRIDGKVTSVRLENFYWRIVAEMAAKEGLLVPKLITRLNKAAKNSSTEHTNFTSFVRVCCGRYLVESVKDQSANHASGGHTPIGGKNWSSDQPCQVA